MLEDTLIDSAESQPTIPEKSSIRRKLDYAIVRVCTATILKS